MSAPGTQFPHGVLGQGRVRAAAWRGIPRVILKLSCLDDQRTGMELVCQGSDCLWVEMQSFYGW